METSKTGPTIQYSREVREAWVLPTFRISSPSPDQAGIHVPSFIHDLVRELAIKREREYLRGDPR